MADKKITQLPERITDILGTDLLPIVANTAGTPANQKVQIKNFLSKLTLDLPATSVSALKLTANVAIAGPSATLAVAEFIMTANASAGYTVQDRYGLIVRNLIKNGNTTITGQMAGLLVQLDTGNSTVNASSTFGLVIDHTLDAGTAAARTTAPRAYLGLKEQAGSGAKTTYLMDVGALGNTVSTNATSGNGTVVFNTGSTDGTVAGKLRIVVNGTDYWIPVCANAA